MYCAAVSLPYLVLRMDQTAIVVLAAHRQVEDWVEFTYKPKEFHSFPSLSKVEDVKAFIELCKYKSCGKKVCVAGLPPKRHQPRFLKLLEEELCGTVVFSATSVSSMIPPFRGRVKIERGVFWAEKSFVIDEYLVGTKKDRDFLQGILEPMELDGVISSFENRAACINPEDYSRMREALFILSTSMSTREFILRALWQ